MAIAHKKLLSRESRSTNIPAQVADKIRSMITRGTLAPGVHLGQSELAETFGASRVPVREALKLLAAEGVVNHDPNRGFYIASLSSDEARQLYRLRHLLEAEVLSTIAWPSDTQLRSFEKLVDKIEHLRDANEIVEWTMLHREFHRSVFALSSESFLVREAVRLWTMADRYRSLLVSAPDRRQYAQGDSPDRHMLAAFKSKDREKLLAAFHTDRTRIAESLIATLESRGL